MKSLSLFALAIALSLTACSDDPLSPEEVAPCATRMADIESSTALTPHTRAVTAGTDAQGNWERWAFVWQVQGLAPNAVTFRWGGSLPGCIVQYGV